MENQIGYAVINVANEHDIVCSVGWGLYRLIQMSASQDDPNVLGFDVHLAWIDVRDQAWNDDRVVSMILNRHVHSDCIEVASCIRAVLFAGRLLKRL